MQNQNSIFKDQSEESRLQLFRDNCFSEDVRTFLEPFTEDEKIDLKDDLASSNIKLARIRTKFDTVKAEYKGQIDPLKKDIAQTVSMLSSGHKEVTKRIFLMQDHENDKMITYDEDGNFVESRRLKPEERQMTIV